VRLCYANKKDSVNENMLPLFDSQSMFYFNFVFMLFKLQNFTLLKMLGCFNPNLGQIWTNPNVGLKM